MANISLDTNAVRQSTSAMIPKIIHYCWFGGNALPKSARRCINSWKRYFPDFEIREWNESNFDVEMIPYTREAYERKKWAFVSDFARFWVLYHYGGLYFDTDVEVIRSMDDILARGAFMGIERDADRVSVAPGLGLGAKPGMEIYSMILEHYSGLRYIGNDGTPVPGTVVKHTTDVLSKNGFVAEDRMQQVAGIWIYPNDWFNPLDDATGRLTVTENTRSIHLYSKTWVDHYGPLRIWMTRRLHRIFGIDGLQKLKIISRF